MKDQKSDSINTPRNVLKSIDPPEEISINISKNITVDEMEKILNGINAFTKSFPPEDKFSLDVKLSKHKEPESQVKDDAKQLTN